MAGQPNPGPVTCAALERRRLEDQESGRLQKRRGERAAGRVRRMVVEAIREEIGSDPGFEKEMQSLLAAGQRPDRVARLLVARLLAAGDGGGGAE